MDDTEGDTVGTLSTIVSSTDSSDRNSNPEVHQENFLMDEIGVNDLQFDALERLNQTGLKVSSRITIPGL